METPYGHTCRKARPRIPRPGFRPRDLRDRQGPLRGRLPGSPPRHEGPRPIHGLRRRDPRRSGAARNVLRRVFDRCRIGGHGRRRPRHAPEIGGLLRRREVPENYLRELADHAPKRRSLRRDRNSHHPWRRPRGDPAGRLPRLGPRPVGQRAVRISSWRRSSIARTMESSSTPLSTTAASSSGTRSASRSTSKRSSRRRSRRPERGLRIPSPPPLPRPGRGESRDE